MDQVCFCATGQYCLSWQSSEGAAVSPRGTCSFTCFNQDFGLIRSVNSFKGQRRSDHVKWVQCFSKRGSEITNIREMHILARKVLIFEKHVDQEKWSLEMPYDATPINRRPESICLCE
jgi:hypothetical protein